MRQMKHSIIAILVKNSQYHCSDHSMSPSNKLDENKNIKLKHKKWKMFHKFTDKQTDNTDLYTISMLALHMSSDFVFLVK